jgi:hypothetical protein
MSQTSIIILTAGGLLLCGVLCAASFRASGKRWWPGLLLGVVLGPVGLLVVAAMHMVGRSRYPDNTGTFASPGAGRDRRRGAPEETGTFAPQRRRPKKRAGR